MGLNLSNKHRNIRKLRQLLPRQQWYLQWPDGRSPLSWRPDLQLDSALLQAQDAQRAQNDHDDHCEHSIVEGQILEQVVGNYTGAESTQHAADVVEPQGHLDAALCPLLRVFLGQCQAGQVHVDVDEHGRNHHLRDDGIQAAAGDDGEDTNDVEQQINGVGVAVLIGFLKDGSSQPSLATCSRG